MTNKKFELLSLKELFDHGKRSFVVPEYQRGYSWEERQRLDLIKDIENLVSSDYRHFTGTVVASCRVAESEISSFDIVDGQQRLTTLIILLTTLLHKQHLSPQKASELQSIYIASGFEKGNTVRKFKLNSLLDVYFYRHIMQESSNSETILTKSHRNISDAFLEFSIWLENTTIEHENLYELITEKLGFILYAPENSSEIGIMFEVINNRGKPLSELEKIKNYLIYFSEKNKVADLRTVVDNSWGEILKNLNDSNLTSNDDENSFLRNCWIVFADTNKSRSYYVYDNLKERFPPEKHEKWKELEKFVHFLKNASRTYKYLLSKNDTKEISDKEQVWLRYLSLHASNASVLPLIIAIYEKINDCSERTEILEILEKLNFRYYGCGIANRSDTGQGDLFLWAHQFYNQLNQYIEYDSGKILIDSNWLKRMLLDFVQKHAHFKLFVEYLTLDKDEDYDYYNWNNLRFFLANYEEYLRKNKSRSTDLRQMLAPQKKEALNDYYHKEHIWARKEETIIQNEEDINKRRIGNFVLLEPSINISVSNDPIEKKVCDYYEITKVDVPNTYMLLELKNLYDQAQVSTQGWKRKTKNYWYELNQCFLDLREERLINFALMRWKIKELDKKIEKVVINSNVESNQIYTILTKK